MSQTSRWQTIAEDEAQGLRIEMRTEYLPAETTVLRVVEWRSDEYRAVCEAAHFGAEQSG